MLAEYLTGAGWESAAPGISVCSVSGVPEQNFPADLPLVLRNGQLEILFCRSGAFAFTDCSGHTHIVGRQDIFILSDVSGLTRAELREGFSGVCVCLDREVLQGGLWDLTAEMRQSAEQELSAGRGCRTVQSCQWGSSLFAVLQCLPRKEWGRYCAMKCPELFYLLGMRSMLLRGSREISPSLGYTNHTVSEIRAYMQDHLDEKLTIPAMSRRFHISTTALKTGFRSMYGQSVHSWLLGARLDRAAQLLCSSNMTVLQVAQEIGYESVGQFHVAFKHRFGFTPSQYRKISVSE